MKQNKIYLLVIVLLLQIACSEPKDDNLFIPDKYFENDIDVLRSYKIIEKESYHNAYLCVGDSSFISKDYVQHVYFHTEAKEDHFISNTIYEIFFDRMRLSYENQIQRAFCLIGYNRKNKGFYIYWINKSGSRFKKRDLQRLSINENTDTIYSNIDYAVLKPYITKFHGTYIKKTIKKITLNYKNWRPHDIYFYNDITFDGLFLGESFIRRPGGWTSHNQKDTLKKD